MINTKTGIAPALMEKLSMELMEDLGVLYVIRSSDEPDFERANKIASQITAPWQLYWLAMKAGIMLHTESAITSSWDMTAAVVAAFYARVRNPQWLQHFESAENTLKAQATVHGRVLLSAAKTLTETIVAAGYKGNFEGSPSELAADLCKWIKEQP